MQFDTDATICGIATGHQACRRGAVRLSGHRTLDVLLKSSDACEILTSATKATRFEIEWNLGPPFGIIPIDVWFWPTERSYTAMPSAELHTIGHPLLLERLIEQLCLAGARMALPGEYTLRAFLAGRMDLTQCEAVLGVIEAKSKRALDTALRQLAGGLSKPLTSIRKNLVELLADIEAGLDFVDEDIEFISTAQITERLNSASRQAEDLLDQLNVRRSTNEVAKVVLTGLPNAGKSSLFNALLAQNSAIVTDQAGTTRDFLRAELRLEHGVIELIDTAGIEDACVANFDDISSSAQSHRSEQTEQADLVLYCVEVSTCLAQNRLASPILMGEPTGLSPTCLPSPIFMGEGSGVRVLGAGSINFNPNSSNADSLVWLIRTKCDDASASNEPLSAVSTSNFAEAICSSSQTGLGLDELRSKLDLWLLHRIEEHAAVAPLTAVRCATLLQAALESLQAALQATVTSSGDEIISGEIRLALDALGQVAGEVYTDDILDALFSRFCIGK
jgi:tRNA modification GTPase